MTFPLPGGCRGGDIRDCLRGDRRREQGREGDILAIDRAHIIGGIGAHVIQRTGCQVGHGAGEGTRRADRSIHGFIIQDGGIGRKCSRPRHAGSGLGRPVAVIIAVPGGGGQSNVRELPAS